MNQSTTESSPSARPTSSGELTTSLNRRWLLKMAFVLLLTGGLGVWGAYDGLVKYPNTGLEDAQYKLKQYLDASEKAGAISECSVKDPAKELEDLKGRLAELQQAGDTPRNNADKARYLWLSALSLVSNLDQTTAANQSGSPVPEDKRTVFTDPGALLKELKAKWDQKATPVALSPFDIPVQYLFMIAGLACALWLLYLVLKCAKTSYRYDPATHRLTLPDGRAFLPTDIDEIDRRLWHKFYVHIKLNGSAEEIKLDLLRFWPLEDWFLEIEKHWPKYVPPAPEEQEASGAPASGEPQT